MANKSNTNKVIIGVGILIILALLFTLTPLKNIFKGGGNKVEILIRQANEYYSGKEYNRALDKLDVAEQSNPTDDQLRRIRELRKKILKAKQGGDSDAQETEARRLLREARESAEDGDYDRALELLGKSRKVNNKSDNPDSQLNDTITKLEKLYKKRQAEQALRDNPGDLLDQSRLSASNGNYDRAGYFLRRASRANEARRRPNKRITKQIKRLNRIFRKRQVEVARTEDTAALVRRARIAGANGDYDRGLELIRKARRSNNVSGQPDNTIQNEINNLRRTNGISRTQQAQGDNSNEQINRARRAARRGDYETALSLLRRARRANLIKDNPSIPIERRIERLAKLYTKRQLRQALRDNPRTLIRRARRAARRGDYQTALRLLRRARRANAMRRRPNRKIERQIARLTRRYARLAQGDGSSDTNGTNGNGERGTERAGTSRRNRGTGITVDRGSGNGNNNRLSRAQMQRIMEQERRRAAAERQQQQQRQQQQAQQQTARQKKKIKDLLRQARRALRQGQNDRAIKIYKNVISIDPKTLEAWSYIGTAYLRKNNLPEALRASTRALDIDSNDANAYLTRGEVYFRNQRDDQAEREFQRALNNNPNLALAYYRLGVINLIKRRNSKAKGFFIKATRCRDFRELSKKDRSKCYYNLGKSNERLRQYSSAVRAYKNSLKYSPNNYKAFLSIGQIYYLQRRYSTSITYFQKSLALKETFYGYFWLGKAYDARKQFNDAVSKYKKALTFRSTNYEARFNLGRAYFKLRKFSTSIENYNIAGKKHGYNAKLLVQIGNSYLGAKNYSKATEYYKKAIGKNSREVEAYKGLARCMEEQNNPSAAIVYLKEGANLTRDASLFAKMGEMYFKLRDYDLAIGAFRKAIELSVNNTRYRRLIADVYFEKKDFAKAAKEYEKVIALNHREWVAYHRLGDSYIGLRKMAAAKLIYKKLIRLNPRYSKINIIRKKLNELEGGS